MDAMEWVRGSLDHCVKCTICETFCPVSNVTPLFPGPKYVGPQLERFRTGDGSPDASLDYCSGCGICTTVCPQGVKIAEINASRVAILMVEQNARRALAMSHRGYVLDTGRNRFEGPGPDLLANPEVTDLYLGGVVRATGYFPRKDA